VIAYFGIQPNGTLAVGGYVDFLDVTIAGTGGNINDDFSQDASLSAFWNIVGSGDANGTLISDGIWLAPPGSAYWINWTTPDNGFDVEEDTSLTSPLSNGINPAHYTPASVGGPYSPALTEDLEGTLIWTLLSTNDLVPGSTNAYFLLSNSPNY
jgi:hypothetical protein